MVIDCKNGHCVNPNLVEEDRKFRRLVREGLTASEIATRLNLPIADVKRNLASFGAIPQNRKANE